VLPGKEFFMANDNQNQENDKHEELEFHIQIDRKPYTVDKREMTGAEIRMIPTPHIGDDRDLFEVVPDHHDRKIENDTVVEMRDGLRFFTAPRHINPGMTGKRLGGE
jgi:hypothetical protein